MNKGLIAMAFGTLVLGIAEFAMMGILNDVSTDLNISITQTGHLISIYAIGVCIGAPLLILLRDLPLKTIMLILACIMVIGHTMASVATNYQTLFIARLISGLPHGAYFGVGSIIASRLAEKGKETQSVSIMIAGMTIANVIGVPLCTALSVWFSWRYTFILATLCSLGTLYSLYKWLPYMEPVEHTNFRSQFKLIKHRSAWLILGATLFANAGVFCMTSYVRSLLTVNAGFSKEMITPLMVIAGVAMVIGNLASGKLSDKFQPGRVAGYSAGMIAVGLLLTFFFSDIAPIMVLTMLMCYAGQFAVSGPEQILIIKYSQGAMLMGGASIQIAFNLGNAIGAYVGGIPIERGFGYETSSILGFGIAILGVICMSTFHKIYEKRERQ